MHLCQTNQWKICRFCIIRTICPFNQILTAAVSPHCTIISNCGMEDCTRTTIYGISRIIMIIVLRKHRSRIRLTSIHTLTSIFSTATIRYTVRQESTADKTIITITIFTYKCSISLEFWIILRIRHTTCITDTNRKSITTKERFTKLSTHTRCCTYHDRMR